jgi:hypothetical protein
MNFDKFSLNFFSLSSPNMANFPLPTCLYMYKFFSPFHLRTSLFCFKTIWPKSLTYSIASLSNITSLDNNFYSINFYYFYYYYLLNYSSPFKKKCKSKYRNLPGSYISSILQKKISSSKLNFLPDFKNNHGYLFLISASCS